MATQHNCPSNNPKNSFQQKKFTPNDPNFTRSLKQYFPCPEDLPKNSQYGFKNGYPPQSSLQQHVLPRNTQTYQSAEYRPDNTLPKKGPDSDTNNTSQSFLQTSSPSLGFPASWDEKLQEDESFYNEPIICDIEQISTISFSGLRGTCSPEDTPSSKSMNQQTSFNVSSQRSPISNMRTEFDFVTSHNNINIEATTTTTTTFPVGSSPNFDSYGLVGLAGKHTNSLNFKDMIWTPRHNSRPQIYLQPFERAKSPNSPTIASNNSNTYENKNNHANSYNNNNINNGSTQHNSLSNISPSKKSNGSATPKSGLSPMGVPSNSQNMLQFLNSRPLRFTGNVSPQANNSTNNNISTSSNADNPSNLYMPYSLNFQNNLNPVRSPRKQSFNSPSHRQTTVTTEAGSAEEKLQRILNPPVANSGENRSRKNTVEHMDNLLNKMLRNHSKNRLNQPSNISTHNRTDSSRTGMRMNSPRNVGNNSSKMQIKNNTTAGSTEQSLITMPSINSIRSQQAAAISSPSSTLFKNERSSCNYAYTSSEKRLPRTSEGSKGFKITHFVLGRCSGNGKFGSVFLARHKFTGLLVAIKRIPKAEIKQYKMEQQLLREIKLQYCCSHPNICQLYGFFDDSSYVYLIMEYMMSGSLFNTLCVKKKLEQPQACSVVREISQAVNYLHSMQIAHRDIKPENIVLAMGVAKLCDFGWSTRVLQPRKTYCGTLDYAPPEILERKEYDQAVDLWCIGILAYELLVGQAPFANQDRKQTARKILNVDKSGIPFPENLSEEAKGFIIGLVRKNPEERTKAYRLSEQLFLKLK